MPTYEFKCKDCGKEFEVFVSIKEKDKVKCNYCGSHKIAQLLSSFYMKGVSRGRSSNCSSCKATSCKSCKI